MSNTTRINELRKEIEVLCDNCDRPNKEEIGNIILSAMVFGFSEGLKASSVDRPQGEWIPCSEKLPRGDAQVLVNVCVDDALWDIILMQAQSVKEYYKRGHINAWMPLPKPYGEREGE